MGLKGEIGGKNGNGKRIVEVTGKMKKQNGTKKRGKRGIAKREVEKKEKKSPNKLKHHQINPKKRAKPPKCTLKKKKKQKLKNLAEILSPYCRPYHSLPPGKGRSPYLDCG